MLEPQLLLPLPLVPLPLVPLPLVPLPLDVLDDVEHVYPLELQNKPFDVMQGVGPHLQGHKFAEVPSLFEH